MLGGHVLSVAIPRPLHGLFTYRVPDALVGKVRVGGCVTVPFRSSKTYAFVVEAPRGEETLSPGLIFDQLKSILDVGDPELYFPEDVFALCRWAHDYYGAPLGEVLNCAAATLGLNLKAGLKKEPREISTKKLTQSIRHPLTEEQKEAVRLLEEARTVSGGRVALLQGVTGSGKTEVYLEVAEKVLAEGKGVIILVPEIALTPQLHQRFEKGLGHPVALWHSALSHGRRRDLSAALRSGKIRIVIGARSAVFAPVQKLGLIVVDEEHDPTYKQEDRVRYQARDLAVVRAKFTQSLAILGSATPSFETRERVREGKYLQMDLKNRVTSGGMPSIQQVDLREEERAADIQAPLALRTLQAIQDTLDAGEQVMVYLNRRGFAAFLLCQECGEVSGCPECSISLTVHRRSTLLRCHVCGHQERIPDICKKCQGLQLAPIGAGTESLEAELPLRLKGARVSRLDRDQVTSARRLNGILEEFRSGKTNLLLGTQMLVKGHDFPGVTLVVVVLADALFRWPDFRATERAFQILKQVSGRAGRGEKPGRVLIQSYDTEHPVLQALDGRLPEEEFLESERELRQALGYPPFKRLIRFRFECVDRADVVLRSRAAAEELNRVLSSYLNSAPPYDRVLEILGPSEAFLERAKGAYRWDLLLKGKDIQLLQKATLCLRSFCAQRKWQFIADMDPYGI